ncbi:MAG: M24 family metallopeptidase [Candidatus Borkfalkiaceae bacterium]|nr:M24 family metallopeptidase [Christensenellaceae bacterium]
MKQITELFNATTRVYDRVLSGRLVGKSEKELKMLILSEYQTSLKNFSFKGDIVAGNRSSIGEGDATKYIIKQGDAVILDLLPMKNGVCSDVTRTFFVGEPTSEQREVYDKVRKALLSTEKILKAGIKACEIYGYMRERLKPYEDTFFHHAGHRIGTRRLMQPQFLPNKTTRLNVGDIVTLEPGIYIKGKFGVRLENDYLIAESGYERLFDYPLDIENFIIRK